MPNYSLVINSKFNPFSYQEMLHPVMMATQAHQELENQYGELATKASVWEEMANEQTDPYAYKMYKTYANDLENQAGQLAREGLNAVSRKSMLNMKSRYSKEIVPIEQAYTARQKQAEQQQQALLQDPTLMLSRRAATTSLDDYIKNPQLAYDSYSGKLITAQVAQAASALSKEMRDNPRKWRSILGNSYYETMMQRGFSSDAVLQAIQNNPNAAPELSRIVEDAVNSSGVRNWDNEDIVNRAYDYARQGLWNAVGETQYQTLDNWRAKMAEQEAMNKRAEARAAARKEKEDKDKLLRMYRNNTSRLFSKSEIAEANKATLAEMSKWRNNGYINYKGQLTNKGWNAIKTQLLYEATGANTIEPRAAAQYANKDKGFTDWAIQRGIKYTAPIRRVRPGGKSFTYSDPVLQSFSGITDYYNNVRKAAASGELVTGVANIKVIRNRVSSSETKQNNLVNLITSASSPIYSAGSLQTDGKIKQGKEFSAKEFKTLVKDNPIVHLMNNPVGNQQLVELSNGQRFFIPKSVFGESLVDPLHGRGDLDRANAIIRAAQEGSDDAIMASANASAYLSSILDTTSGDDINYHGSITEEELYQ